MSPLHTAQGLHESSEFCQQADVIVNVRSASTDWLSKVSFAVNAPNSNMSNIESEQT